MGTVTHVRAADGSDIFPKFYQHLGNGGSPSLLPTINQGRQVALDPALGVESPDDANLIFSLPFSYQVGTKSLLLFVHDPAAVGMMMIPVKELAETVVGAAVDFPYFEELTTTTVILRHADVATAAADVSIVAVLPHTATPAEVSEQITVNAQGSGVGIQLLGQGDGILLKSSGGLVYKLVVDDDGHLMTES